MGRKSPKDASLYRKVLQVPPNRTVRVAAYPPRNGLAHPTVTLGIGYANPDAFSKIYFEVTEESWKEVQAAVRAALKAAEPTAGA